MDARAGLVDSILETFCWVVKKAIDHGINHLTEFTQEIFCMGVKKVIAYGVNSRRDPHYLIIICWVLKMMY